MFDPLADPKGALGTRPSLSWSNLIIMQFSAKILPNNSFLPPNSRVDAPPPVWKILDPLLSDRSMRDRGRDFAVVERFPHQKNFTPSSPMSSAFRFNSNVFSDLTKTSISSPWKSEKYMKKCSPENIKQEMLFSIVLRFGNSWLLLCLE